MRIDAFTKAMAWHGAEGILAIAVAAARDISPGWGPLQLGLLVYGIFKLTYAVAMIVWWK